MGNRGDRSTWFPFYVIPSESRHSVVIQEEILISPRVALESRLSAMAGIAVGFHNEALLRPVEVNLDFLVTHS